MRLANGGGQELFGVVPDLAVFGKGIGNGYPISAVMGAEEIMSLSTDVFFSGTFGGEALSLAACKSVLEFYRANNVIEDFRVKGEKIINGINFILNDLDMCHVMSVSVTQAGHLLTLMEPKIFTNDSKTFFSKKCLAAAC